MSIGTTSDGAGVPNDDDVSVSVVHAVADETGVSPTELPALTEFVDPDALDDLVHSDDFTGIIDFVYHGHRVRVTDAGEVMVG